MELNNRQRTLLRTVVREYIETAEPVGSQTLCSKYGDLNCSPATIRNELARLEELGYLTHPYTSAGRIPTDMGYRLYVNELMEAYTLTSREKALIDNLQNSLQRDMQTIMQETLRTLQSLSQNYTAIVHTNDRLLAELTQTTQNTIEQSRKESLYLSGLSRMLYEPEFENIANVRKTMEVLDSKDRFLEILNEFSHQNTGTVSIGKEINDDALSECSLVIKEFHYRGETIGSIGMLGPTRMKYSKVTTAINSIAEQLDNLFEQL